MMSARKVSYEWGELFMNHLKMLRLYVGMSLIAILVMGFLATWMNPAYSNLDVAEIIFLLSGTLLLIATFFSEKIKRNPEPLLFGYLWVVSAGAFVSLMQQHYNSMLLIAVLMMYFIVSQILPSLNHLKIYMVAIELELILFLFISADFKKTVFALVVFTLASTIIYLSTGKRLQMITKYQETENALRVMVQEKNLYERAVRDVGSGVIIADALVSGFPIIYVNDAFTSITGYTSEEVVGRSCKFLQGKDTKEEHREQIRAALNHHSKVQLEILNYRKNHEPFWNELVITPLKDETGITTHFIGLQTDVTKRQQLMQSEQQSRVMLERVLRDLKDAVIVMRPDQLQLQPVMMNAAAQAIFTSLDSSILPQLDAYKELIYSIMSGDKAIEQEIQLLVDEGIRYYRVVISRLDDLVMLTFNDITMRKKSEHQLVMNRIDLEQRNQAKDQFMKMLSQEFRTPLNAMIDIAREQEHDVFTSEEKRKLKYSSEHLLFLIDRFLDYSALENGELHFADLPFNLHELVLEASDKYRGDIENKLLDFRVKVEQLPNILVLGDSQRVMQIVDTLLDNAVKFTQQGHIEIVAAVRPHREQGKLWFMLTIKDTGVGISEEMADDIFQPFFQLDAASPREYEGMGFGLALSRRLTETLGGTISYQSRLGEGTTFVLKLPVTPASPEDSKVRLDRKLSILLAEDNIDNQNLFLAFVKKMNCSVDVSVNGYEVVKAFTEGSYDMVFMDIQMPLMDGYEATRLIRKWELSEGFEPTAIIALTAHAFEEHRRASYEAGCTDFLEKPIFMDQLFQMIRRYGFGSARESGGERDVWTTD